MADQQINKFREQINKADQKLLQALIDRFQVTAEIGKYKKAKQIPLRNYQREADLIQKLQQEGAEYNLDPLMIKTIMDTVIEYSVKHQNQIINE